MKAAPTTISTYLWSDSPKLTSLVAVGLHKVDHKDHETTLHSGMFYQPRTGVKLLDLDSWSQRDAAREKEDTEHQAWLVEMLRQHDAEDQAKAIEANQEMGSLRYRPEEVSAASGLKAHPASYTQVQPEGTALRQRILSPPAPKPTKPPRKKPR